MNLKRMKNLFLILVVMFALTACSQTTTQTSDDSSNYDSETAKKQSVSDDEKTNQSNKKTKNMANVEKENFIDLAKEYSSVIFKTNMGDVKLKLYSKESPVTVNNFLNLAKNDFYDGVKFHRVIKNFMIQSGDPLSKDDSAKNRWGTGGPGYAIEDEFIKGLTNKRGTIAMANSGPNSGGSQFFINVIDNTRLDWDKEPAMSKHPVFGEVIEGMDIVDEISKVKTLPGDKPVEAVIIEDIELVK